MPCWFCWHHKLTTVLFSWPRPCRGASTGWKAWARWKGGSGHSIFMRLFKVCTLFSFQCNYTDISQMVRMAVLHMQELYSNKIDRQVCHSAWPFSTDIFNFIIVHPQHSVWHAAQQPAACCMVGKVKTTFSGRLLPLWRSAPMAWLGLHGCSLSKLWHPSLACRNALQQFKVFTKVWNVLHG